MQHGRRTPGYGLIWALHQCQIGTQGDKSFAVGRGECVSLLLPRCTRQEWAAASIRLYKDGSSSGISRQCLALEGSSFRPYCTAWLTSHGSCSWTMTKMGCRRPNARPVLILDGALATLS